MNWPIGDGPDFQGIYDRMKREVHLFETVNKRKKTSATIISVDDPDISEILGNYCLGFYSVPFSNFICTYSRGRTLS
jgi:peptide subunit release factor RF-3